ncbi:ROK family transcriptional regulator [Vibrio sp.]|nr:ROK family transcriptional regulator [Vibrio sp.]
MNTSGIIGNVDLVKQLNGAAVYRLIDQEGPISRIQIAESSQLAPASVTKITRQLLEKGLIKEVAQQASTGGRRAISLTTDTSNFHSIAIRLGRDYIQLSLMNLDAQSVAHEYQHFTYNDASSLETGLLSHLNAFLTAHSDKTQTIVAIGITLPGLVDPTNGIINYMPNTNIENFELADKVRSAFSIPCFLSNDVKAMALAEHYFGKTKDCQDSIVISVHRGTGSGIIINGDIFLGFNRNVGEIGHIQVDPLGEQCQCGNFGCLETIASNPAIVSHINKKIQQGFSSSLENIDNITITDVCQHANQGDDLAKQALINVGNYLGKAIAITINLFNPQKVVLAGAITECEDIILPALYRNIENQSLKAFSKQMSIVSSQLTKTPTLGAFAIIKKAILSGELLQLILDHE